MLLRRMSEHLSRDDARFPLSIKRFKSSSDCIMYLAELFNASFDDPEHFTLPLPSYGLGLVCAVGHLLDALMSERDEYIYFLLVQWYEVIHMSLLKVVSLSEVPYPSLSLKLTVYQIPSDGEIQSAGACYLHHSNDPIPADSPLRTLLRNANTFYDQGHCTASAGPSHHVRTYLPAAYAQSQAYAAPQHDPLVFQSPSLYHSSVADQDDSLSPKDRVALVRF